MKIYIASKTKYAPEWRKLRGDGVPFSASWIDEAGEGESKSVSLLAKSCVEEAAAADCVIFFASPGEIQKGALVECGAALAAGKPVICVGRNESVSSVFEKHPRWYFAESIEDALSIAPTVVRASNDSTRSASL